MLCAPAPALLGVLVLVLHFAAVLQADWGGADRWETRQTQAVTAVVFCLVFCQVLSVFSGMTVSNQRVLNSQVLETVKRVECQSNMQ